MNWRKNFRLSVRALGRARVRTVLSASSMAIGITAVVLLFGVGAGAEQAVREALETMGKNLLAVGSERRESNALRGDSVRYDTLTLGDWRAINDVDGVERAAPIAMQNFDLRYQGQSVNTTVIGTTPEFQLTNNARLVAGRFIDELDMEDRSRVAILGAQIARELFYGEQPIGELMIVSGSPFRVIGVLEEKGVDQTGAPQDDRILIPVTTAQRRLLGVDYVDRIFVQAVSREIINSAMTGVRELLRDRHGLDQPTQADDFTINDQAGLLKTLSETDRLLTRFLAGTAALTLGLASVGLLAVSLLSVRERHHEIGLRRAVGALPREILAQFLSESVMIALLGAAIGLLAGGAGIILGEWLLDWSLALTPMDVAYTFLIALCLSLLFGAWPAWRAAQLDPIVALNRK